MEKFIATARTQARGLIGTWVKIPSLATVELLGHAGFDFVVIDMEHAPHALDRACEMIFAAQSRSTRGRADGSKEKIRSG
jgi:2-keto-3-deoxy-L-rhamnonate aldolase RhmA